MDIITPCATGVTPVYGDVCIRKQRRKRQKKLLVILFMDYAQNTTLHGLRYIADTGLNIIEKIFWFVTFFVSLSVCSFLIFEVWRKWQTSPVIVSFNARYVSVEEVPFPSITICPASKFAQEAFNYTEFNNSWNNDSYWNDPNNSDTIMTGQILELICDYSYGIKFHKGHFNASHIEKLLQIQFPVDKVIPTVNWKGKIAKSSKSFKKVLTKSGICYNFNGLASEEIFNTIVQSDFNYTETTKKIRHWTNDDGYTPNADKDAYPYKDKIKMRQSNLFLSLRSLENLRDAKCNSLNNGFKFYLHHPTDYPQMMLYHFAVSPKQVANVAIKFTKETAHPDLGRYPVERRQCYFPNDRKLIYFRHYTFNNCMFECYIKYVYKRCGCVEFYMPFHDSTKICTSSMPHVSCIQQSEGHFAESNGHLECKCLPACNSIQYDAEVGYTEDLIGEYLDAQMGEISDFDYKQIKDSRVDMYYKQPMFRSVQRSVLFGLTDFLGNCGGLLGLFLGFSWISLIEVLYFLTFRVYKTIKKDLKNEKKEKDQPNNNMQLGLPLTKDSRSNLERIAYCVASFSKNPNNLKRKEKDHNKKF